MELGKLTTETRNESSMNLDQLTITEAVTLMNQEDVKVPRAIKGEIATIAKAVELIVASFNQGGRLIYMGAGTSGRLGVLDAAECVPTFSASPEMVVGLIAGGKEAMLQAVEGAEDSVELGEKDLQILELNERDTVVGIAASGRTPYVIGGLKYAQKVGASTVTISCNKYSEISQYSQVAIEIDAGPEVLTGSTRLKAGTAQKLVLNMLSTVSMVQIGKVYQNLMVDVQPTNLKLEERSKRIIMQASECDYETASQAFVDANKNVKVAIMMVLTNKSRQEAEELLTESNGFVRKAIQ
ncbi:N-acetylmuramic acid 6-phosphate etherase [Aerococcaceae bacterium WGS1372]